MRTRARAAALFVSTALGLAGAAAAAPGPEPEFVNGRVVRVRDGDTLVVSSGPGAPTVVRLWGVDAPETGQPNGPEAKRFTETFVAGGKAVSVRVQRRDLFDRVVGELLVDGRSLNREIVRAGLAWWNEKEARDDADLERIYRDAKLVKRGLWTDMVLDTPWDWRRQHPRKAEPFDAAALAAADVDVVGAGLLGAELRADLRRRCAPVRTLDFAGARRVMVSWVDDDDGFVVDFFAGVRLHTLSALDLPEMAVEHLWPQPLFGRREPLRSDLHNMRPVVAAAGADRAEHGFAEIADEKTLRWWGEMLPKSALAPSDVRDRFSEATDDAFEPRESVKGDTARALFYFAAVHEEDGIRPSWLRPQLGTLLAWHEKDPVDAREELRGERIEAIQGNVNPFAVDPTLAARAFVDWK